VHSYFDIFNTTLNKHSSNEFVYLSLADMWQLFIQNPVFSVSFSQKVFSML